MEKEEKVVPIYDSFKTLILQDESFREVFMNFPALAYYLYVAGGQLCNRQMDASLSECLREVLVTLPDYEGKPTYESLEADSTGEVHKALNDQIAPNCIMYLIDALESGGGAKQTKKRALH